jgi:hypothetical protein
MKSQLFYIEPKLDMIVTFLNDIESFRQNKYIITPVTYKQAEYHNKISPFINTIKPYYHKSKLHYLDNINYKRLLTIVRQLCRHLHIYYKSEIKYIGSSYFINYHIYIHDNLLVK